MRVTIGGGAGPEARAAAVTAGFAAFTAAAALASAAMLWNWAESPAAVMLVAAAEFAAVRAALSPGGGKAPFGYGLGMLWLLLSSASAAVLSLSSPFRGPFRGRDFPGGPAFDPSMGDRYHAGHVAAVTGLGILVGFLLVVLAFAAYSLAAKVYETNLRAARTAAPRAE